MSKSKEVPAAFQLSHMEVMKTGVDIPENLIPQKSYHFEIGLESLAIESTRSLKAICEVAVFERESSNRLAFLQAHYIFTIADFNNVVKKDKKGNFKVPSSLQVSINTISMSTTRGVLWSMLNNTQLSNVILPVIDPEKFGNNELE